MVPDPKNFLNNKPCRCNSAVSEKRNKINKVKEEARKRERVKERNWRMPKG